MEVWNTMTSWRDVTLRVFGNFTLCRNKILFADEPVRKYKWQQQTGTKFQEFTGYVSEGLFVAQGDINAVPANL